MQWNIIYYPPSVIEHSLQELLDIRQKSQRNKQEFLLKNELEDERFWFDISLICAKSMNQKYLLQNI